MREPTPGVVCAVCGGPVYDYGSEFDRREACPRCGSLTRRFYRTIEETLTFGGDAAGGDAVLSSLRNEIAQLTDEVGRLRAALDVVGDPLTGLRNKPALERTIAEHVGGDPDEAVAVLFMDLEKFKECNDTHGHDAGDVVLKEFVRRATEVLGGAGELFRCGGDEFVALLESTNEADARDLAGRVCTAVRDPAIDIGGGRTAKITTSIGIACRPPHGGTATDLIRLADLAMYESKRAGGDRYAVAAAKPTVHRAVQKSPVRPQNPPKIIT